jgi:hypothetical protein
MQAAADSIASRHPTLKLDDRLRFARTGKDYKNSVADID